MAAHYNTAIRVLKDHFFSEGPASLEEVPLLRFVQGSRLQEPQIHIFNQLYFKVIGFLPLFGGY